ncbi:MAG: hypothetical protein AAFZ07_28790 [Actinomycetota bacterium]
MTRLQDLLVTGIVAATLGTTGGALVAERRLAAALADRPPLAVVDYGPLTDLLARRFAPADLRRLDTVLHAFKAEARALADDGYVVLNAAMLETTADGVLVLRPELGVTTLGFVPERALPPAAPRPQPDAAALQELLQ